MRKVRWIALLAVLALVAAACGNGTPPATTTATSQPPASTSTTSGGPGFEGLVLDSGGCPTDADGNGSKIDKVEATAENTVVFTLCSPDPAFLAKIAFTPFAIQSGAYLDATNGEPFTDPVGTGPFKLVTWDAGNQIVMESNTDYWGTQAPFSRLVFQWRTDSAQRIDLLTTAAADYITALAESDYATIEANPDTQVHHDQNPNVFYVGFNNRFEPWDDVRVRQAVSMGIDRQRIIDTFYPAGSEVADFFTPCSIAMACGGTPFPDFDPVAARALLAEAGFPNGFDTSIYYRDVFRVYLPEPPVVAQELQAQLLANLNINATIVPQDSGFFLAESAAGNHNGLHLLGWGADYPAASNFLDSHFGAGSNNQFGDKIPEVVSLLNQAGAILDQAVAGPLYAQVNDLLVQHTPMFPVAWGAAADAARTSLQGAATPLFGAPQFHLMNPGDDDLVFVQNAEPISGFCMKETDGESLSFCQQINEGLYGYDVDGTPSPRLATSCEGNADATVFTCTLRSGVKFHNGTDLTANDVVRTFSLGLDPNDPLHVAERYFYFDYLWGTIVR